jgi:hypothetical protein
MMATGGVSYGWEDLRRALQQQFGKAVSPGTILLVIGAIAGVVFLLYALTRLQEFLRRPRVSNDGLRLFRHLVHELSFPKPMRRLLWHLGHDTAQANPSVLLISEKSYDRCAAQWLKRRPPGAPGREARHQERLIQDVRAMLFPSRVNSENE